MEHPGEPNLMAVVLRDFFTSFFTAGLRQYGPREIIGNQQELERGIVDNVTALRSHMNLRRVFQWTAAQNINARGDTQPGRLQMNVKMRYADGRDALIVRIFYLTIDNGGGDTTLPRFRVFDSVPAQIATFTFPATAGVVSDATTTFAAIPTADSIELDLVGATTDTCRVLAFKVYERNILVADL
jgi:hypothetical protein